jgi:hypothetical protein
MSEDVIIIDKKTSGVTKEFYVVNTHLPPQLAHYLLRSYQSTPCNMADPLSVEPPLYVHTANPHL